MGGRMIGRQAARQLRAKVGVRSWSALAALLASLMVCLWAGPASAAGYSFAPTEGVVFSGTVAVGSAAFPSRGARWWG
jgi:hypothetical protein